MGPHQGALETVGTASATPTPERVDAVRRRVLFLLAPSRHAALASVFFLPLPLPPSSRGGPRSFSFPRPVLRSSFTFFPPLFSQNRRPYLSRPALAWASPLALYPTALARTPAFSSHRRASRLSFSLRCFATASRTPSLPPPCSRTPAFLPRRRTGDAASPARITPRPRERSVTTKVLVKS